MTATTKTPKPTRKTWLDFMPREIPLPETVMTRPEFVERLNAEGIDVTARTLAFWEANGVIPRAVRRRINGVPHSVYPEFMVQLVKVVRKLQDDGASLTDIEDAIWHTPWFALMALPHSKPETAEQRRALWDEYHDKNLEVRTKVMELSRILERLSGVRVVSAELQIISADGGRVKQGYGGTISWDEFDNVTDESDDSTVESSV